MIEKIFWITVWAVSVSAVPPQIARPCNLQHLQCIGENLAANSACNIGVRRSLPGQYRIEQFKFETPYFNSSYIDRDLIIKNHDKCYVSEFFFNTKADSAVLSIDCENLVFESNRTYIQHYTKAEDSVYSYTFSGTYPLITFTINFKTADTIDLCSSFTFADVAVLPIFNISPNDLKTRNTLSTDPTFLYIFERETFLYRANQLARTYINSFICDFGCNY